MQARVRRAATLLRAVRGSKTRQVRRKQTILLSLAERARLSAAEAYRSRSGR